MFLKIKNFNVNKNSDIEFIMNAQKITSEEVIKLIKMFHKYALKMVNLISDKEIFTIDEIIEFLVIPSEFLQTCHEAV